MVYSCNIFWYCIYNAVYPKKALMDFKRYWSSPYLTVGIGFSLTFLLFKKSYWQEKSILNQCFIFSEKKIRNKITSLKASIALYFQREVKLQRHFILAFSHLSQ